MKKMVLQACCAPCAAYPIKKLKEDGYEPVVFFYNPNIYPFEEYEVRRKELRGYCKKTSTDYYEGTREEDIYYDFIKGLENEPEKGLRCNKCFYLRLEKTALFTLGLDNNIKDFTTTLSVSPHKNSKLIFEIGNTIAKKYGLNFLEYDFKKQNGFKISRTIAKENNMYAQKYCGCKFSMKQG